MSRQEAIFRSLIFSSPCNGRRGLSIKFKTS
jgi:hypothetical protein